MSIPESPFIEAVIDDPDGGPGIVIIDVSAEIANYAEGKTIAAKRDGKKRKRKFSRRDPDKIDTLIIHKSGGNGPPGFRGALATTGYVVYHRGWHGAAYTFWASRELDRDPEGRLVIYRLQPDTVRSWHTGGRMNNVGIALGIQGNYDGQWDLLSSGLPRIEREPTEDQWYALPLFCDWVERTYPFIVFEQEDEDDDFGLTGHWEHGKPVCPGDALRVWVRRRRGELIMPSPAVLMLPKTPPDSVDPYRFDPEQYQKALLLVGYDPGPIDGKPGVLTRGALEEFQAAHSLKVDGWYGPDTASVLLARLQRGGLALQKTFDDHPPVI